jgi:predicted nucleic acid-binding protein
VTIVVDPRDASSNRYKDESLVTRVLVHPTLRVDALNWRPWIEHASEMNALRALQASDRLSSLSISKTSAEERACFLVSHLISASWLRRLELTASDLLMLPSTEPDRAIGARIKESLAHSRRVLGIGDRRAGRGGAKNTR